MKEKIVCSAVHYDDGVIYSHQPFNIKTGYVVQGMRHHHCINTHGLLKYQSTKNGGTEQGFITNKYRFVDRGEGLKIAIDAKQTSHKPTGASELFSEDLY